MTATLSDIKEHDRHGAIGPSSPGENGGQIAPNPKSARHPRVNHSLQREILLNKSGSFGILFPVGPRWSWAGIQPGNPGVRVILQIGSSRDISYNFK